MSKMIMIDQRVISTLLKQIIKINKRLTDLSERPEYNKDYLSISDIETEFGLSRKIIDGYRKKGLKYTQKTPNGKILIMRSDLEKFIAKKQ